MSPADVPILNLIDPALGVYLSKFPKYFYVRHVLSLEKRTRCRIEIYSKERGKEGRGGGNL